MGFGGISVWQLLILLAIVVMIFGTKRLRNMGGDLGSAIKGFRSAMHNGDDDKDDKDGKDENDDSDDAPQVLEHNSEVHSKSEHEAEPSTHKAEDRS